MPNPHTFTGDPFLSQILNQDVDVLGFAQAAQGAFLDLAHTLAGEIERVGHFLGRHFVAPDAEEHFQHLLFAIRERGEGGVEVGGERFFLHENIGAGGGVVRHDVDKAVGVVVLEGCVYGNLLAVCAEGFLHLRDVRVEQVGQFLHGGAALKFLLEVDDGLSEFALEAHLVERHAHDAALLRDGLQDALAYPPNCV